MILFILLALSCLSTVSATPKCPPEAKLFERVPTAENNHTKHWCLEVVIDEKFKTYNLSLNDRENARSVCISRKATVTIPENAKELEYILEHYKGFNEPFNALAIDGEISPRCRARRYRASHLFYRNETGLCNIKKAFLFDDANTDPSFLYTMLETEPGNIMNMWGNGLETWHMGYHLYLHKQNNTGPIVVFTNYGTVVPEKLTDRYDLYVPGVLCGRHPL